jgi:hypothetical protein
VAQFGSFEFDRRLWRIKGKRNGAAVEMFRRSKPIKHFGHRKSKLRSSAEKRFIFLKFTFKT